MIIAVEMAGISASPASTGCRPPARWRAGQPARQEPAEIGMAATIDRTSSATNPNPAAAATEPVTVLPRNVSGPNRDTKPGKDRHRDHPPTGIGSNRIAV